MQHQGRRWRGGFPSLVKQVHLITHSIVAAGVSFLLYQWHEIISRQSPAKTEPMKVSTPNPQTPPAPKTFKSGSKPNLVTNQNKC